MTKFTTSDSSLTIIDSTLDDNTAGSNGGGVFVHTNSSDALLIDGSTFSNNNAATGGALVIQGEPGDTTARIVNSTFSGNDATGTSGAIRIRSQNGSATNDVTILNSTITNNEGNWGGGLTLVDTGSNAILINTIITGNTNAAGTSDDNVKGKTSSVAATVDATSTNNIFGDGTSSGLFAGAVSNYGQTSVDADDVFIMSGGDPLLADNGGKTKTHALTHDSLALDAAHSQLALESGLFGDQRDISRFLDGDQDGMAAADIGAYEAHPDDFC